MTEILKYSEPCSSVWADVSLLDLEEYVKSKKWVWCGSLPGCKIYHQPGKSESQIQIPDADYEDKAEAVLSIINKLSTVEQRSVVSILYNIIKGK